MYIYIYMHIMYIYNIPYNYSPYFLGYTAIFRNMSVTVFSRSYSLSEALAFMEDFGPGSDSSTTISNSLDSLDV